ncbi:MAG TPA: hypothetical protein VGQ00_02335 [Candidatus Norongarragalinales archaeon]|nr:hypothetical protein [Candidatus Norongarragalinales archaeon]
MKKRHEKAALMNEEMARFLEKHREELSRGKMPQELPKMSGISRWAREQVNPRPEAHVLHRQRIDATIYLLHGRAKAHGLEVFALNQFLEARKKVGGGPKFRKPPL